MTDFANTKVSEGFERPLLPKFEIIQTNDGLVFRRNANPVFEAKICKGEGEHSFELKDVVYHLKSDFTGNFDKLRSAAKKAKSIIIQKALWIWLEKL